MVGLQRASSLRTSSGLENGRVPAAVKRGGQAAVKRGGAGAVGGRAPPLPLGGFQSRSAAMVCAMGGGEGGREGGRGRGGGEGSEQPLCCCAALCRGLCSALVGLARRPQLPRPPRGCCWAHQRRQPAARAPRLAGARSVTDTDTVRVYHLIGI
eukprot:SAG31_NODE_396_length_16264_cov_17.206496_3_plen_154_part_00